MQELLVNIDYECEGIKGQLECIVIIPGTIDNAETAIHAQVRDRLVEQLQYDAESLFQNRPNKQVEREEFFSRLVKKTNYTYKPVTSLSRNHC